MRTAAEPERGARAAVPPDRIVGYRGGATEIRLTPPGGIVTV
jgi:hypothetical protein